MFKNQFFLYTIFSPLEPTIDEDRAYCLRCARLSTGECDCTQCEVCKIYYAHIDCHKCANNDSFCITCGMDIISSTNMCVLCDFDAITEICESITPTNQMNSPQCLRCLEDMVENRPCPCKPCEVCNVYCAVNKPHKQCSKSKVICHDCNNYIISQSKKCLLCELENQKRICKKCPLLIKEGESIYCECANVSGGGRIKTQAKKLILKYAFGMNNSILDIYLNTQPYLLFTPHGYLTHFKQKIMREINPLIKKKFATSANFFF